MQLLKRSVVVVAAILNIAVTSAIEPPLPPRYKDLQQNTCFLITTENGGVTPGPDGPDQYNQLYGQAVDGVLTVTLNGPTRICPCSDTFGAKNVTGFFVEGQGPQFTQTLQLFTSSPAPQYVYVDRDLTVRYTLPGAPLPPGANGTSIYLFTPTGPGGGQPNGYNGVDVEGVVTQANGTQTEYKGLQFCAPPGSPPGTQNGIGPLTVKVISKRPGFVAPPDPGCVGNTLFTSTEQPVVAPYDPAFNKPSEPLAFAYQV